MATAAKPKGVPSRRRRVTSGDVDRARSPANVERTVVAHRVQAERSVSAVELELQAEVDKFAVALLVCWDQRGSAPRDLRARLQSGEAEQADDDDEDRDQHLDQAEAGGGGSAGAHGPGPP